MDRKNKGKYGEALAAKYLINKGYIISHQNWYCRWGEIDIVACDKDTTVFVEVKYRTTRAYGAANKAVNRTKINSLRRSIWRYLGINSMYHKKCRLDVVCIEKNGGKYNLRHYKSVIF